MQSSHRVQKEYNNAEQGQAHCNTYLLLDDKTKQRRMPKRYGTNKCGNKQQRQRQDNIHEQSQKNRPNRNQNGHHNQAQQGEKIAITNMKREGREQPEGKNEESQQ